MENSSCFVFRDDLLGGLVNGTKLRKYSLIFDHLKKLRTGILFIPGSLGSNHVLASCMLAKQAGLDFLVLHKKSYSPNEGNAFLLSNLALKKQLLECIDPDQMASKLHEENPNSFIMPRGGYCKLGALSLQSLTQDILTCYNEIHFKHLVLDTGTGLSAASLILGLADLPQDLTVWVVLMGPLDFNAVYDEVALWLSTQKPNFQINVIAPKICKGFGSRSKMLDDYARSFFQNTGILLDPVYSSKLFYTFEQLILEGSINGPSLIIHSGGTLSGYFAL